MDILATSIWLRYLELCGEEFAFPSNGYQGDYVWDIGASLHREHGEALHHTIQEIFTDIPPDAEQGGDKEIHIDALIARSKQLLGETAYQQVFQCGLEAILKHIRQDLEKFGVVYDNWFSERSLMAKNTVQQAIEKLTAQGHTYQEAGALWFRSSAFGDEKDRVVIRENGQFTYFASDIAYHLNKLERGFDRLINIWGSDHHGYVPRLKAVITALGADAQRLSVLLVQFVTLYRGQERVQMSTRSGEYVTLRELREEVGRDAARFFYVQRKSEQHLDFDLELAKTQSIDNPVYYIQYAYARIASVFRQLQDREQQWNVQQTVIERLNTEHEQTLLITLSRYPEVIDNAVRAYEPHQLTFYLRELANHFHTYYNAYTFLVEEDELRNTRLSLIAAVQQVLKNGLTIIGISTPEVM
jgi:arginyl-tRNA synthetase